MTDPKTRDFRDAASVTPQDLIEDPTLELALLTMEQAAALYAGQPPFIGNRIVTPENPRGVRIQLVRE